jgi:hypothetical protein
MQSLLACLPLLESLLTWYVWFFIPMKDSSMLCRAFGLFVVQLLISKGASVLELLETEAFFWVNIINSDFVHRSIGERKMLAKSQAQFPFLSMQGGSALIPYMPELMDPIVDALLDGAAPSKREVAVATLGQIVESTG